MKRIKKTSVRSKLYIFHQKLILLLLFVSFHSIHFLCENQNNRYYQALPGRDRAGRRILGNFAFDAPKSFSIQSRLRVGLYCILSVLEDVETQRKGIIGMSWWHNVRVDDFILRGKVHKRINCAPIRLGALHCCIPSECSGSSIQNDDKNNPGSSNGGVSPGLSEVIKAMFVLSIGSKLRPHFRMHTGEFFLFYCTPSSAFKKFERRSYITIFRSINIIF